MSLAIRKTTIADTKALFRVCLFTADAGKSGVGLYNYPELPGLTYAVPYLTRKATWAYVLEEEDTKEVVGYVVGSHNTREYESDVFQNWYPIHDIRYLYDSPLENPETKPGDRVYLERFSNPTVFRAFDANIAFSPAHLHINILEQHQRKGWGIRLIAKAVEHLKGEGLDGLWVGVDPRNDKARNFYKRIGFKEIEGAPDVNQLGLKFADFVLRDT
jgi:ribosomal protein S18 acetylase RimI-like enzyme